MSEVWHALQGDRHAVPRSDLDPLACIIAATAY